MKSDHGTTVEGQINLVTVHYVIIIKLLVLFSKNFAYSYTSLKFKLTEFTPLSPDGGVDERMYSSNSYLHSKLITLTGDLQKLIWFWSEIHLIKYLCTETQGMPLIEYMLTKKNNKYLTIYCIQKQLYQQSYLV